MTSRKTPTREKILETLRRRGPATVAELARRFRLSTVAVRQNLAALAEEGFVRADGERPSRGRPAQAFRLTPAAKSCFPDRSAALALEILMEVEATAGREAVVRALEKRGHRTAEAYRAALKGRTLEDRLRVLARLRDAEGYVCDPEPAGDGHSGDALDIVEKHCPVSAVAKRFPEVCRIEQEIFSRVLGVPVLRTEHMLAGDGCCRYRVDGAADAEV